MLFFSFPYNISFIRVFPLNSLCEFLSKYSKLRSETIEQDENITNVVEKLWHYVSYSEDAEVVAAALKSLSCFDLDQIKLKSIPDVFRQNLKLPASYVKTPIDAAQKPEEVLPYIPGMQPKTSLYIVFL